MSTGISSSDRLHLGSFNCAVEGWLNTDITPHIWIARVPGLAWLLYRLRRMPVARYQDHAAGCFRRVRYMNLCKRVSMVSERFAFVYSAHVLEHLYADQARFCIQEVYRVLKKGGIFRVCLPDLDQLISSYDARQPDRFCLAMYETAEARSKNQHHWMYNRHSIESLLSECGFGAIHHRAFRQGVCPDLDRLEHRSEGSLYVEAVK